MGKLTQVRNNSLLSRNDQNVYGSSIASAQKPKDSQMNSIESTTYKTTAYRSSSGAIILNRIATTTMTHMKSQDQDGGAPERKMSHTTSKQRIRKIVIKKKKINEEEYKNNINNIVIQSDNSKAKAKQRNLLGAFNL